MSVNHTPAKVSRSANASLGRTVPRLSATTEQTSQKLKHTKNHDVPPLNPANTSLRYARTVGKFVRQIS